MKDKMKSEIVNKYNKLKEQLGHKPSSKDFFQSSGINRRSLQKIFGRNSYSKLMDEAGDAPNVFSSPGKSVEELLIRWGEMVRKVRAIPTQADWDYYKFAPSTAWYRIKFGSLLRIPARFREFAQDKKEWEDVLALLPKPTLEQGEIKNDIVEGIGIDEENIYYFLPSGLNNLCNLGCSEGNNIKFEKGVSSAFQALGFKVRLLGQGSGRNPDGIAYDSKNHCAIIYDAKARKDGYSLGTDDRVIIEYINSHKNSLNNDGLDKIYFLIISNKFNSFSKNNLNRIMKETGVPVILLKTEVLLTLVSKSIKNRALFDLGKLQDLFIENGELDKKKIDRFTE